ncbi:ABC transporter transmembrane domain-containing protein [Nocardioides convexus]|uniref:ABC transporter transmembrane domain-containing protein n=1 Tax=Nocardioides convexus TaxID=2712224 RepID=UPI0024181E4A|nr:ABC transporter transmembrane domain-containing protein [Nocardioides convexus]
MRPSTWWCAGRAPSPRTCSAWSPGTPRLAWLAAINFAVWVVESASEYVAAVLWRGLAQGVEHDLRVEAYDHAQHLHLGWHESRASGSTLATLNDDVNQTRADARHRPARDPADRAQRAARRHRVRRRLLAVCSSWPSCRSR